MKASRRRFLKAATAGTAATACAGAAEARGNKTISPDAVGLLYDGTLCIGCRACMSACKEVNQMPPELTPLKGENGRVEAVWDAPLDLSGRTLNVIRAYRDGVADVKDRETDGFCFSKMSCYHCVDPSCVSACPVKAMQKDPVTGIVSHNPDACIGCRYCVAACPFGVPRFTYDLAIPHISKCQLCRHRTAEGKYAACAEVCPTGATLFGPVSELKKEIARRRSLKPGTMAEFPRGRIGSRDIHVRPVAQYVDHVYGEHEIGGTQVLHLSAVPFDKLGKPRLPDVAPASVSESMQHALYHFLIAPLAFLGGLVWITKRNVGDGGDVDAGGTKHEGKE
jgi:Fe-S-cluster-containing dehydrogenase component